MIELAEGFWLDVKTGIVVKDAGEGKCNLFTPGQSAVDGGFLIERDAQEVVDEIEAEEEDDGDEEKD